MGECYAIVTFLVWAYFCITINLAFTLEHTFKLTTSDSGLKTQKIFMPNECEIGAKNGSLISVHYTGYFENGTKFDSSVDRNETFRLILGFCPKSLIRGWVEGLQGMCTGEKKKLIIPPHLGYGVEGKGIIPGNATLHFDVELVHLINNAGSKLLQEVSDLYNCTEIRSDH